MLLVMQTLVFKEGAEVERIIMVKKLETVVVRDRDWNSYCNHRCFTNITGDGSALTGISVGIGTESSTISGITTYIDLGKDDHEITASGICMLSVKGGTQGDSHTVRITNSGITTVNFDSYFKFPGGAEPALPTADGSISMISFTVHKAGAVGVNTVLLAGASVSFS